jgi:hypothetical protein
MKTFNEFCAEAYQLDEFVNLKDIKSNLSKVKSAVTNNPVVKSVTSNPIVRTGGRVVGGALNIRYNRIPGLEKLTTDDPNVGPIERGLGGISAASPPGVSQATGFAHNLIGMSPQLKKIDKRIGKEHGKAYKANPQAYTQMLGRSF